MGIFWLYEDEIHLAVNASWLESSSDHAFVSRFVSDVDASRRCGSDLADLLASGRHLAINTTNDNIVLLVVNGKEYRVQQSVLEARCDLFRQVDN